MQHQAAVKIEANGFGFRFTRWIRHRGGVIVNVEFDKVEKVKDPFKARMKK